jgi:hypothetical protein
VQKCRGVLQRRFAKRLQFPQIFLVVEYVSANDFAVGTFQRSHEDSVCNDVSEGSRDSDTTSLLLQHQPLDGQGRGRVLHSPAIVMSDESVEYESDE